MVVTKIVFVCDIIKNIKNMIVETKKLMRFKTYAEKIGKCKQMVRVMIQKRQLDTIIIDNTIFVVVRED